MITGLWWRIDGLGYQVLLIGTEPYGEVGPVPGRKTFSVRIQMGKPLLRQRVASRADAIALAEHTVDDWVRDQLTDAARTALAAAGL